MSRINQSEQCSTSLLGVDLNDGQNSGGKFLFLSCGNFKIFVGGKCSNLCTIRPRPTCQYEPHSSYHGHSDVHSQIAPIQPYRPTLDIWYLICVEQIG